ncbi:MAG: radical SAM protein, partial [bacterium]
VDIYMPDFQYWREDTSKLYLKSPKYPATARAAFKEMYRQVGNLEFDDRGLARRGMLVRHLVMPGALEETREIMRFLSEEISPHTFVNVMDQYRPAGRAAQFERYKEINRRTTSSELEEAYRFAREAGLYRFDAGARLPRPF